MNRIPFVKASACGNDFLIIDELRASGDMHAFTREICDRHNGVGADGVEWTRASSGDHDVSARLINSDGSDAEISGNGTRCVAAWWTSNHGGDVVRVKTGAGVKVCKLVRANPPGYVLKTEMGVPEVKGRVTVADIKGVEVSLGNPHFVVFVEDFSFDWQAQAQRVQPHFPRSTNVGFVRVIAEHEIECRFYERGARETQSSGTGSCASAVAAIHEHHASSPVSVIAPGGAQIVRWNTELSLEGPTRLICEGEFLSRG